MVQTKRLADIAWITMGTAPPGESYNSDGEGIPLIAGAGDYGELYPLPCKFTTQPTSTAEPGDLLVCVRATIGDLNWADKRYCLGRGVAGIRAKEGEADINYLAHFIRSSKAGLERLGAGSTFPAIRKGDLENLAVPTPPLDGQRRIAAILDKADSIRRKRTQTIEYSDKLISNLFYQTFGDPIHNPKGWPILPLKEACTHITDGVHARPTYTESGVPFVSVKDITTGTLDMTDCKFISKADHLAFTKRCKPEYMDILYTKVGATYGRPALVDTTQEFSIYVSVALIKPNRKLIDPVFLKEVLASQEVKRQADCSVKGAGVPDLHLIEIRAFKIPLPTMSVQKDFVHSTKRIHALQDKLHRSIELDDRLLTSLVNRAFRGEL